MAPDTLVPAARDGVDDAPALPSTRERLLDAAIAVVREQGYEGARVAEIARRAGLTTGAIYANWPGKAELVLDAMRARAGVEIDALLAHADDLGSRAVLEALGAHLARPSDPDDPPLLLDAIVAARRDPALDRLLTRALASRQRTVRALATDARAEGALDPELDADAFVRFAVMLALGGLVVRALELPPTDPDAWSALVARVLDGFAPTRPTTAADLPIAGDPRTAMLPEEGPR